MALLIIIIIELVQVDDEGVTMHAGKDMQQLPILENAYLLTEGDLIKAYGKMADFSPAILDTLKEPVETIDAEGKMVFPSYCDSHTHLVYAGSREVEYIDKIKGLSYEEIAKRGGGINNSAKRLAEADE